MKEIQVGRCRLCRYLRHFRSASVAWAGLEMQMLSLFTSFPLCEGVLGRCGDADFVAIYVTSAL